MPEITRKLYDLTVAGQLDAARDLQYRLLHLFDAMLYSAEFPEGFRAALRLRGFATGMGRQPKSASQQIELDQLGRQLQCLLAAEGFADEPVGGCPVALRRGSGTSGSASCTDRRRVAGERALSS